MRVAPVATGFMPAALIPACDIASSKAQLTRVLPQPVSVPVTNSDKLIDVLARQEEKYGRHWVAGDGPPLPRRGRKLLRR